MESEKTYGPIIGLVVILLVIALGSVYFLQQREQNVPSDDTNTNVSTETSDEINIIESDLDDTSFEDLDAEFEALDEDLL